MIWKQLLHSEKEYRCFYKKQEIEQEADVDFSSMKKDLLSDQVRAEKEIAYIKEHPGLSKEELHEHIYEYVLFKYNLSGDVDGVFVLDELAQQSVAKAIKLSKERAIAFDNKGTCEGATSAMNKKVLLMMAIQRELELKFPLDKTAGIKTTYELAAVIWEILNKQGIYQN